MARSSGKKKKMKIPLAFFEPLKWELKPLKSREHSYLIHKLYVQGVAINYLIEKLHERKEKHKKK